jgi:DNA-binding HxlR family transcriptional regulator
MALAAPCSLSGPAPSLTRSSSSQSARSLLVLREPGFGVHRFNDIQANCRAPRETLALRPRTLEEAGVIERQRYCHRPPRDEYVLTAAGRDLTPVLTALHERGQRHATPVRHDGPRALPRSQSGTPGRRTDTLPVLSADGDPVPPYPLRTRPPSVKLRANNAYRGNTISCEHHHRVGAHQTVQRPGRRQSRSPPPGRRSRALGRTRQQRPGRCARPQSQARPGAAAAGTGARRQRAERADHPAVRGSRTTPPRSRRRADRRFAGGFDVTIGEPRCLR